MDEIVKMTIKKYSLVACLLLASLVTACNSYGLVDLLENPGGSGGRDGSGGGEPPTSCGTTCRIFVSQQTRQGDFGGPAQADAVCMSDANRPSGNRIWKALLVDGQRAKPVALATVRGAQPLSTLTG